MDRQDDASNRLRAYPLSVEFIRCQLAEPSTWFRVHTGLPEDIEIKNVFFDDYRCTFVAIVSHPEFDVVEEGTEIPFEWKILTPEIYRPKIETGESL